MHNRELESVPTHSEEIQKEAHVFKLIKKNSGTINNGSVYRTLLMQCCCNAIEMGSTLTYYFVELGLHVTN